MIYVVACKCYTTLKGHQEMERNWAKWNIYGRTQWIMESIIVLWSGMEYCQFLFSDVFDPITFLWKTTYMSWTIFGRRPISQGQDKLPIEVLCLNWCQGKYVVDHVIDYIKLVWPTIWLTAPVRRKQSPAQEVPPVLSE